MDHLIKEAEQLAADGVKELILVAQETTLYGKDLYGEKKLPELLHKLCQISGIRWIRILYCYPEEITEELIQTMKEEPKICHYLDLPDSACKRRHFKENGKTYIQRGTGTYYLKTERGDPGHHTSYNTDYRIPGRDAGTA